MKKIVILGGSSRLSQALRLALISAGMGCLEASPLTAIPFPLFANGSAPNMRQGNFTAANVPRKIGTPHKAPFNAKAYKAQKTRRHNRPITSRPQHPKPSF